MESSKARAIAVLAAGVMLAAGMLLGVQVRAGTLARGDRAPAAQGQQYRAALVVQYSDGFVDELCIPFSEDSISGEELLKRSGLDIILDYNLGPGGAVCSIDGDGCAFPSEDCWCQCPMPDCEYWAYWHLENGAWVYAQTGATGYPVSDGAVEGWSWGPGDFASGVEPPLVTFEEICGAAAATSTPTQDPGQSPTPTATKAPGGAAPPGGKPPQAMLEAAPLMLAPGACTLLRWSTADATAILLNGQPVLGQDQREECPEATTRYVLVASNAAGETTRELTIMVTGGAGPVSTVPPAATQPRPMLVTQPPPVATAPPPLQPGSTVPAPGVTPLPPPLPGTPGLFEPPAPAGPLATATSEVDAASAATATAAAAERLLALLVPPTAPPTVRPRQAEPSITVTPILLARAGEGQAAGSPAERPARPGRVEPASRSFQPGMLLGYAAFAFTAVLLLGAGAIVVLRRRR